MIIGRPTYFGNNNNNNNGSSSKNSRGILFNSKLLTR